MESTNVTPHAEALNRLGCSPALCFFFSVCAEHQKAHVWVTNVVGFFFLLRTYNSRHKDVFASLWFEALTFVCPLRLRISVLSASSGRLRVTQLGNASRSILECFPVDAVFFSLSLLSFPVFCLFKVCNDTNRSAEGASSVRRAQSHFCNLHFGAHLSKVRSYRKFPPSRQ